jgi:hypothetical protein
VLTYVRHDRLFKARLVLPGLSTDTLCFTNYELLFPNTLTRQAKCGQLGQGHQKGTTRTYEIGLNVLITQLILPMAPCHVFDRSIRFMA